jgi:hypothetical protein
MLTIRRARGSFALVLLSGPGPKSGIVIRPGIEILRLCPERQPGGEAQPGRARLDRTVGKVVGYNIELIFATS